MRSRAVGALVLLGLGATACASTGTGGGTAGASFSGSLPRSVSSLVPSVISAAPASGAGQQPLAGPQVSDAALFPGGGGYVRTRQALLWTDDLGATWRNVTPPGLTATQLQSAGIAVQPAGHEWLALAPDAGSSSMTLLQRTSTTQSWTSTSVPLGPLSISPDAAVTTYLSFTDANNGWMLVGEQITHTGFGELLRTTDAGATWTLQADQSTLPVIGTIRFLTPEIGYLDTLWNGAWWWTTRDAGHSWARLNLPVPAAKKSDSVNVLAAPALAGDAIVVAASFTTPDQGNADGIGIYRSTDGGVTWMLQQLPSEAINEQYNFATTPDGSTYLLLREHPAQDFQSFTWVTSRSTNRGTSFTGASSVHNFYPGPLTLADPNHLWTLGGANGCKTFKTDCWNDAGLIASNDGGSTWHQVKLPT
jgi:photosystem II stability/assembly factor-like uncharacterized protein